MTEMEPTTVLSRRHVLSAGGRLAGGLLGASLAGRANAALRAKPAGLAAHFQGSSTLEHRAKEIQKILQAPAMVDSGVISVEIDRDDIKNVTLHGVPILPSFQINGGIYFMALDNDRVFMNGDMALKSNEIDPFIDKLIQHNIVFQAEHQHFYDFEPIVWFIHFRAVGEDEAVAAAIKAALDVTSTPFPQSSPQNPTTPLPVEMLAKILGGSATVGSDGVVTVDVPRADEIILGGYRISHFLNVQTNIVFEPYGGGQNAAAAPDFGMIASEVQGVISVMRAQGWDIGCLYNQETDEHPQLFFSHNFKTGDATTLAWEIRRGLNLMNMAFE